MKKYKNDILERWEILTYLELDPYYWKIHLL